MARITRQKAEELIETPVNREYIDAAILHEERLAMHVEPFSRNTLQTNRGYQEYDAWVKDILPEDKYKRFLQFLTNPLDTVDSTESIFDELKKVFDAQDKYVKYNFTASELEQDFTDYLTQIKDDEFWRTQGFEALKIHINSFVVCDLPSMPSASRAEPYYYFLNIRDVITVKVDQKNCKVEYIAFEDADNRKLVIDDEYYRIFVKEADGEKYIFKEEIRHTTYVAEDNDTVVSGIGYCPVTSFWHEFIKDTNGIDKSSPITNALGKLDWLLWVRTGKKYLESYTFPIIVTYDQDCDFEDEKGNRCTEGFITKQSTYVLEKGATPTTYQVPCPACTKRSFIGAGTEFTVSAPRDKEEHDMMLKPVDIVEMNTEKLQHLDKYIEALENEIYLNCVGFDGESINKEAINETQVAANFESKESVIMGIKDQLEKTMKFVAETLARMRYGAMFLGSEYNLGTEFYLTSVEDLVKMVKEAEAANMPSYFIDKLKDQIVNTKFRTNSDQRAKNEILKHLEPYAGMTAAEMQALRIDETDVENFIIKLNFVTFIRRFERENMDLTEFGTALDFNSKIKIITQKLTDYAKEIAQSWVNKGSDQGSES